MGLSPGSFLSDWIMGQEDAQDLDYKAREGEVGYEINSVSGVTDEGWRLRERFNLNIYMQVASRWWKENFAV